MKTFGVIVDVCAIDRGILGLNNGPEVGVTIRIPELDAMVQCILPHGARVSFSGLEKLAGDLKSGDDVPITYPKELIGCQYWETSSRRLGIEVDEKSL